MKRIYVKNNYLIIECHGTEPLMRPKKDISFRRASNDSNQYMLADRSHSLPLEFQSVKWNELIKENGEKFQSIDEFNEWITANTGNFSEGSEYGTFEPLDYDLAEFNNNSEDPFLRLSQKPKDGKDGRDGTNGVDGLPGKDGINGKDGAQGLPGKDGINGNDGIDGKNGLDGAKGEKGDKGDAGAQGIQGLKGDQGIQGIKGDKGDNGAQGLKGETGLQGSKGDTGATGAQGIQGLPGVNSFGFPTLRTSIAKATAYQALNPSKPAVITITLNATSNATLTVAVNNSANIIIGSTNAVASGTGTIVGKYNNALSVGVLISTSIANTYTVALPANWYFAIVNANNTTGVVIDTVVDQSVG